MVKSERYGLTFRGYDIDAYCDHFTRIRYKSWTQFCSAVKLNRRDSDLKRMLTREGPERTMHQELRMSVV